MAFLPVIALPYTGKHFFRHFSVKPAYAIGLLASVQCKNTHRKTLVGVGIFATHVHQVVPGDAELGRILTHVFAEEAFVEIVVTGRHRCVDGVKA